MSAIEMVPRLNPFELACAFPPKRFLFGAGTTIEDLSHHGLNRANPLFVRCKRDAVKLIVATHYWQTNAYGHGNRAKRRSARLGIVVTEWGVGRFNAREELEMAFGVHVSPKPASVRPASVEETAAFFRHRAAVGVELRSFYNRHTYTGD